MNIDTLKTLLGLCVLFNMVLLIVWFLLITFTKELIFKFHSMWFKIRKEEFDSIHYKLMGFYKILNITFFLMPYLALVLIS